MIIENVLDSIVVKFYSFTVTLIFFLDCPIQCLRDNGVERFSGIFRFLSRSLVRRVWSQALHLPLLRSKDHRKRGRHRGGLLLGYSKRMVLRQPHSYSSCRLVQMSLLIRLDLRLVDLDNPECLDLD